ncbi:hypothetical protein I553_5716 [Mycobacterium xenopi 4042]|uniref:Uncharacterized protein n=1 Tax=Mycobacterium xenopi 4042 TaxID=1299334 RepID=X7ZW16_MYCXE|nr:hypothetical protein I553_5716 [Mycobacterium xenopi 4042]
MFAGPRCEGTCAGQLLRVAISLKTIRILNVDCSPPCGLGHRRVLLQWRST